MNIRKANIADIDDIMKVEWSSFIAGIQEEKSVFEERIRRCPDLFLIFEQDDNVAGYLCAEFMDKVPERADELELGHLPADESLSQKVRKGFIYISSFAILPAFRGAGVGRRMWNESLEYLREHTGVEKFLLLVNEEWKGARHIYESSGFSVVREFPEFFVTENGGRSAGVLMEK